MVGICGTRGATTLLMKILLFVKIISLRVRRVHSYMFRPSNNTCIRIYDSDRDSVVHENNVQFNSMSLDLMPPTQSSA